MLNVPDFVKIIYNIYICVYLVMYTFECMIYIYFLNLYEKEKKSIITHLSEMRIHWNGGVKNVYSMEKQIIFSHVFLQSILTTMRKQNQKIIVNNGRLNLYKS